MADVERLVLSVDETAVMLGVSPDLVRNWLDAKVLPEMPRWSRRRLVPRKAIELIIEQTLDGFHPEDIARYLQVVAS